MGITPFGQASEKICHAQLPFKGIRYSKFHLDDLKTVGEV